MKGLKRNQWFGLFAFAATTFGMCNSSHAASIVGIGGNCLDVTGGNTANGTPVQMWKCQSGNENQDWTIDNGRIVWTGTKKCLDVRGGDKANGTDVQIWTCDSGNENQQWTVDNGRVVWTGMKRCLDVSGGGTSNGTPVQIWQCQSGNENQAWTVRGGRTKGK